MNCSKCNVGEIQKTEFISDYTAPNKITTAYGCNRCSYGWAEEGGRHTVQTGPLLKLDHSKQEMIAGVIADLIDSGLDEDAHFRNRFITSDSVKFSDFRDIVTDIEKLNSLMSIVRDYVIITLKKVADDLEKEELK